MQRRNEIAALAVGALGVAALALFGGRDVPFGLYGVGIVSASLLFLHAAGVILAYRSNRFLNIAQVQIGALGGTLFAVLVQGAPLPRLVATLCPPCLTDAGGAVTTVNYVLSFVLGMGLAVGISRLMYAAVVRRFADTSPLILTVASIFVVQVLAGMRDPLVSWMTTEQQRASGLPGGAVEPGINLKLTISNQVFSTAQIALVVTAVVALVGISLYLRRSAAGTAIRAAADNRERAQTLGINVGGVVGRVWTLIGLLSGAAAMFTVMGTGESAVSDGLNVVVLTRILAVVVIARLSSLGFAAAGAVLLAMLSEVALLVLGSTLLIDGALVVIIGVLLLLQSGERRRSDTGGFGSWRANREQRPVPAVLRGLPEVRRYRRLALGGLTVVVLGLPWVMSPGQVSLLTVALIYAILGLSLLVLTGWAGLVSLGQFAFAAIGGYIAAVTGLPPPLAIPLGGLAGAVAAVVVGFPALRLRGLYLAVTTLAFSLTTTSVLLNTRYLGTYLPQSVDKPSLLGMDLDDQRVAYYLMLTMLLLAIGAVAGLRRSRTARALIASRDNEPAAQMVGIGLARARLTAFAFSGFLAAVAGVLLTYQQGGVLADSFSPEMSVQVFVFAVVGGFGSIAGPLLGFAYFAVVSLASTSPTVLQLASGIGGLALVLAAPGGLIEVVHRLRDSVLRRLAKRRRLVVPGLLSHDEASAQRAPLRPKTAPGGGTAFVPRRYGLANQWAVTAADDGAEAGAAADAGVLSDPGRLQEPADV